MVRWQQNGVWVIGALLFSVVAVWGAYRYGLPVFADAIAQQLPEKSIAQLGEHVLETLDESVFKPSELPDARQKEIIAGFEKLAPPNGKKVSHTIRFRKSPQIGANAFALPSGDVVITDQLINLQKMIAKFKLSSPTNSGIWNSDIVFGNFCKVPSSAW